MSARPRVLLVDDNQAILSRAAAILSDACVVLGSVTNGEAALGAVDALKPDVIVLDVSLPGMSGIDVAIRLRSSGSSVAVVFLTVHHDEDFVQAAQRAGGMSYVLKPRLVSDLVIAVLEAHAGRSYLSGAR